MQGLRKWMANWCNVCEIPAEWVRPQRKLIEGEHENTLAVKNTFDQHCLAVYGQP